MAFIQQKIDSSSSFRAPECVLSKHKGDLNLAQWTDKRVLPKGGRDVIKYDDSFIEYQFLCVCFRGTKSATVAT